MLPSLTRAASTGCSKKVTTSVSIGSSTFSCISGTVVIVGLYGQQEYIIIHLFGYSKGVDSTVHSFCPARTALMIESISAPMILSRKDKRGVLYDTLLLSSLDKKDEGGRMRDKGGEWRAGSCSSLTMGYGFS